MKTFRLDNLVNWSEGSVVDQIEFGNTGFRIIIHKDWGQWDWHFTPESNDVPPALADMPLRVKFVRMFMYGFKSFIEWFLQERSAFKSVPESLVSTTNKTQRDFLIQLLGEANVESYEVDDGKYFTRILIDQILEDKDLMKKLLDNQTFILKHPITVNLYDEED